MHKLVRSVRFSIDPFLEDDTVGANSFCSKPCGQGLALFFELTVSLAGSIDSETGFFINVMDIDAAVRQHVVPIFASEVRRSFKAARHIDFDSLFSLLKSAQNVLSENLKGCKLIDLTLVLNPFRKLAIDCEDLKMIYFSEKFEFAAMHKLWNDKFSTEQNFEVFGKCANPSGHGHNYIIEVTVKMKTGKIAFKTGAFEEIVDSQLINLLDHKNLNVDVPFFTTEIPTVENIAVFSWQRLNGKFPDAVLHAVNVWETDKTCSSYYG